jgi:hypothetical protein
LETYLSLEQVTEWLGISEGQVTLLATQGRLSSIQVGDERRFELVSVGRMFAEEVIRRAKAKAEEECPELLADIELLAGLQYQRGMVEGARLLGEPDIEAMGKVREQLLGILEEVKAASATQQPA